MNSQASNSSDQAQIAVARKFYDSALIGDWDGVEKCVSKNIVVYEADGLPFRGVYRGIAEFKQVAEKVFGLLDNCTIALNNTTVGGGNVVAILQIRGRSKSTGREMSMSIAEVLEFENNLISSIKPHYWDTKTLSECVA